MGSWANFCWSEKDQPGKPSTRCPSCGMVRCAFLPPREEGCPNSLDSREKTKRKLQVVQSSVLDRLGQALLLCPQFVVGCSLAPEDQGKGPPQAPGSDESCWRVWGLGGRCLCKLEEKKPRES